MSREAMQMALEALESDPLSHAGLVSRKQAIAALRQALETDLARVGEVGLWGECEPQEALEDGWCDWVCPKPTGYLMQCCDCGLIHEVESRVAKYEPRPSEVFEVVNDPDLQVQWRMKRRDDISPKQPRQWQGLTDEEILTYRHMIDWTAEWSYIDFARAIEAKLREKNAGEYRNGATTERTKLNQENT